MMTFLIAFIVIGLAVTGMALGVLLGGHAIKGSCGGLNQLQGMEGACGCAKPCEKRRRAAARQAG